MGGNPICGLLVEVIDRAAVSARVIGGLGGYRVDQVLLDLAGPQIRLRNRAGDAAAMACAVECHHIGFADHASRLHGHQFGITGAQAHTPERSSAHSFSLAIAFTAAAAMALPPRRPRTNR